MGNNRDFKGVWIPKEVWLDARLTALDKVILTEIDSLDNENGCSAGNEHLAKFCQCSETKVSTAVKKLITLGYIYQKSFDGRIRILKSRLSKSEKQDLNNLNAEYKKVKVINKDNNTNINYKYIIDHLNEKTKSNYRSTSAKTQTLIKARVKEGFTEEDFIKVIDNMVIRWTGTEWEQYLRPETLFGVKFEGYLNTKAVAPKKSTTDARQATSRNYTTTELNSLFTKLE